MVVSWALEEIPASSSQLRLTKETSGTSGDRGGKSQANRISTRVWCYGQWVVALDPWEITSSTQSPKKERDLPWVPEISEKFILDMDEIKPPTPDFPNSS